VTTEAEQAADSGDFDVTEVGRALVTLAMISKLMAHSSIVCTAQDYLSPHDHERAPEWEFVLKLVAEGPDAVLTSEQAGEWLQHVPLPPINA
jgi:hypothetical protein